jgi:methylenetetrahydrofolate dehydrogenase (NADP+)/methenyltetrahydrofolate cyclohydrolase
MADIIDGEAVAREVRDGLGDAIDTLADAGLTPTLATVLMSDDPASETYVSMKQDDCEEVGIDTVDVELETDAPAADLLETVDELNADSDVNGILVQMPVPDHVDERAVLERIDPAKDVDGFHPENVGKLVAGEPRFVPCTPHGIQKLLADAGVDPEGTDVVIVGRSDIVGKPLANLLIQKQHDANATVTVCHSRTQSLSAHTRQADVLVAAAGAPELIDGSMLREGVVVIDVGTNRVETDDGSTLVGDVEFDSAKAKASAITPVPGGVGPMTRAMLLYNTVKAASEQADVAVELP